MGRLSNPIQRLILQLGELRSSQLRLLSQSQQIWFRPLSTHQFSLSTSDAAGPGLWNMYSRGGSS